MSETDEPAVLVVDDNTAIADTYSAFLTASYDVRTAYDGESAIEALDSDLDVILLDRRMPDVTGDEVLEKIDRRGLNCQVVMLTAVDPEFDIVDMPFDDYVVKPVGREDLNLIVEKMLDRADYGDDLREFLSLLSKKSALESEKDSTELAASTEYREISDRIEQMREELRIDPEELEQIFDGNVHDILPD